MQQHARQQGCAFVQFQGKLLLHAFLGDAAHLRFQLFENHNAVLFVEKPGRGIAVWALRCEV
jgi:hypothetical protein